MEIEQKIVEGDFVVPEVTKMALEAGQIDGIIEHLNNINIEELVKHQSILRIEGSDDFKTLYQEFFVAKKGANAIQFHQSLQYLLFLVRPTLSSAD